MNKKQLVAKLAGSLNQSKADAERTFDTITNTILDALKGDDSVNRYFLRTAFINLKVNKGCFYMQILHIYLFLLAIVINI